MNKLWQLSRHFVVSTKLIKACPNHTPTCFDEARDFGKALLVLQSTPEIIDPEWRRKNPFLDINYMGDTRMTFNTEELMADIEIAGRPSCQCSPNVICRSNDGVNPE